MYAALYWSRVCSYACVLYFDVLLLYTCAFVVLETGSCLKCRCSSDVLKREMTTQGLTGNVSMDDPLD